MTNGVMSFDANGIVRTFNPAAASILSLDADEVVGRTFAQVFVPRDGFEEFNEVVLASIYGESLTRDRRVAVNISGRTSLLELTTSYLTGAERGVVAVFVDVSETEALRAKEKELGEEVERQHGELESRNRDLGSALRRVQITRVAMAGVLAALVAGVALYGLGVPVDLIGGGAAVQQAPAAQEHEVGTGRIESIISVPGQVAPLVEVPVRSPLGGTVAALYVEPGQQVRAGERLLELDIETARGQRRKVEVAYLRALSREQELTNWEAGSEVAGARESVTRAGIALATARNEADQTNFLYEQGLVPRAKKDSAAREQHRRKLALDSANRNLEAVLHQGEEDRKVAVLETHNARAERDRLDRLIADSVMSAPIRGVVLGRRDGPALATGTVVKAGDHLMSISEGRSLAVRSKVDEIRVREIRPGDRVRISGAAFPGTTLHGRIVHVSAHAARTVGRALPLFEVVAAVDDLEEEQAEAVRLGMSATMDVVVYERDDAVLVPVAAVNPRSKTVETVDRDSGTKRPVPVKVGRTTADAVEILEGLSPGDVVLVP